MSGYRVLRKIGLDTHGDVYKRQGEMFHVTCMDLENVPKVDGTVDYSKDMFQKAGKPGWPS